MPVFVIGQITVRDASRWQDYLSKVGGTIARHGGEVQFRGGLSRVFAGAPSGDKVVMIKFADQAAADRWHDSPEYQALVAIRDAAATVTLVSFSDSFPPDSP
ncbi:MAG: DUF1330 domain-containing protein [Betaproteobacteria bacterium]|nr:DUF1330 domain-containing protein [Betaproteobacteria bacterium]